MTPKERAHSALDISRSMSEGMVADFKTPEQWTHQVFPTANHALWCIGHIAWVDNRFISRLAPELEVDLPGYKERFAGGSTPSSDPAAYPPPEQVVERWRERRKTLLAVLERQTDADLEQPAPQGVPGFLKDRGNLFEFAAIHESIHTGQLSMARRSLGHAPLRGGPPKPAPH